MAATHSCLIVETRRRPGPPEFRAAVRAALVDDHNVTVRATHEENGAPPPETISARAREPRNMAKPASAYSDAKRYHVIVRPKLIAANNDAMAPNTEKDELRQNIRLGLNF